MIVAKVEPSVSGEVDLDKVTLVVVRNDGKNLQKGGFKFYAARETVPLPSIPQQLVDLSSEGKWFSKSYSGPSQGSSVTVARSTEDKQAFSHSGSDLYWFNNLGKSQQYIRGKWEAGMQLPPGFELDYVTWWHGRTDTNPNECNGMAGGQYFNGNYSVEWVGDDLRVRWAVWYCHVSPYFLSTWGGEWLHSVYGLSVYVAGPRGVPVGK